MISGTVTDQTSGEPIAGANVLIKGTNSGTSTDFDGTFELSTNTERPFSLEISFTGYQSEAVSVSSSNATVNVSLKAGTSLDEVVISASRRPEKVQNAPASVSILTAKNIENSAVAIDPIRHLVNVPGVHVQQQSANTLNIEMRAGSGVFGTSTFPILDYRYMVTPSAGVFLSHQTGMSNIDIDKIEVVRGAASALYGPGVTSGVVHFMSKSPIDHPGTTVEILGGTMNTFGRTIRHASVSKDKKIGFKVNARWVQGDDFELDAEEDADFIAAQYTSIAQPAISGGRVNPALAGTTLLTLTDLDDNGDGNPLATKYKNYSANMHLEFRPEAGTRAFLSGGFADGGGLFFNSQGAGYTQGKDYWTQARIQTGGLFAQVFYNYNDGGSADNPTFLYASGFRQIAKRASLEAQLQYNFETPDFLDSRFTVGTDYRNTKSDSENTLFGVNDDDDDYIITGAYLQGTSKLSDQLELTYAGRYDKFNFIDEGAFAPRIALVYKASQKSSFRVSYNVATFGPTALEQNIDFPVSVLSPGILDVWLSGQTNPQNFSSNPTIDLSIPGLPDLPYGTQQFPLAYAYGAVAGPTLQGLYAGLAADPSYAPLLPVVQGFFNSYVPSGGSGQLIGYNLFNNEPMNDLVGTGSSEIGTLNSFEVGYKGTIGDKFSVGLDFYTYERKGFTQFTAIGPTYMLAGSDFSGDLGATVGADFAADPTVVGAITAGVLAQTQAYYTANGYPLTGIPGVLPSAADAAAAATPGAIAGAAAAVGGAFMAGGAGFDSGIAPLINVIGTVETDRVPQGDGIAHIPAGYRRFGDATRSHYGADLSVEYFADDAWTLWGNASWLSQNEWIPGEDDDDDLPFSSYLNAPKFKYRLGANYSRDKFRGGLSFQHDGEFMSNQGAFSGFVKAKNLFDANFGYIINEGVSVDISASNLFDHKYRAYPSMPIIGRRVILKATFNL
ncbi:MAG: TonB-dependent receptor [Lutibacter sp.]|nr:TonB-dependent receptor [Lutibacter sp.]